MKDSIIKDINLAEDGKKRIEWVRGRMPVLDMIRSRYEREKPLENVNVMACLHVTVESFGVRTYAYRGESDSEYYDYLKYALEIEPTVVLDDGADAITTLHTMGEKTRKNVMGTCEETTTGVIRHQARAKENKLGFPVIAVNNAETKMMFDNRYGTGQSTLHGIMNATNILLAGRVLVVGGYGWCGRGVALRAKGLGSNVIVVEANPRKALEAVMDGYRVMPMREASKIGDVFVTATGDISVIRGEHFALMKDGVILANTGHFNVELNVNDLEEMAVAKKEIKENVVEYKMKDGRKIPCQKR
jgi:adenosylhomocysteinase